MVERRACGAALAALVLSSMTPGVVTAGPKLLRQAELDRITASGLHVETSAFARASGAHALAATRAHASTATTENLIEAGVGFAEAQAFACCRVDSDIAVGSRASSTGSIVHSTTFSFALRGAAHTVDAEVEYFRYGYSATFLVAFSSGDGREAGASAVGQVRDDVRRLVGSAFDRRGGMAVGAEFTPVITAGLRWRALNDFLAATRKGLQPLTAR